MLRRTFSPAAQLARGPGAAPHRLPATSRPQRRSNDFKAVAAYQKLAKPVPGSRPQAGFLIVRNNPIPSENPPDSLAITGLSDVCLSDGVQRYSTTSDDEVGGRLGGQLGTTGEI